MSKLIIYHFSDEKIDDETVNKKIVENKKEYCNYIYAKIKEVIEYCHNKVN